MSIRELQKVLYVDDEQDIQAVVKLSLEAIGHYTVQVASSGQEALDVFCVFRPDMVLLDVMMPDMDGMETIRELRKMPESASTPVIFMTAKVQPHEIAQYKSLGAADVICKPFDPMTLPENILKVWKECQVRGE